MNIVKLILATFFWGSSYYLNKIALTEVSVYMALSLRLLLATIILGFFYIPTKNFKKDFHHLKSDKKTFLLLVLFSLTTISTHYYFMYDSLNYLDAGIATVLVEAGIPISQFFVAVLILKETISKKQIIAIATSIVGLIMLSEITPQNFIEDSDKLLGYFLIFISVLAMMFSLFMSKKINNKISVIGLVFWSTVIGSFIFHAFSFKDISTVNFFEMTFVSWFSILYLGIFASAIAFIWYYGSLKYYSTSFVSTFLFLIPIWGFLVVLIFSNETFTYIQYIGVGITLVSLWFIINKKTP